MARCFDCLDEFAADADRFAVLKQTRDWPAEYIDAAEARELNALLFDPVYVCRDCSGWYGDDAILVTAAEAAGA